MTEPAHMRAILEEIWRICHVPTRDTPHRTAYTHFQADFDRIRALCAPYADRLALNEPKPPAPEDQR